MEKSKCSYNFNVNVNWCNHCGEQYGDYLKIKNKVTILVQLLSHIQLLVTPWTAAHQASLSFTISHEIIHTHVILMSLSQWCHPTISSSLTPLPYPSAIPLLGTDPEKGIIQKETRIFLSSIKVNFVHFTWHIRSIFPFPKTVLCLFHCYVIFFWELSL